MLHPVVAQVKRIGNHCASLFSSCCFSRSCDAFGAGMFIPMQYVYALNRLVVVIPHLVGGFLYPKMHLHEPASLLMILHNVIKNVQFQSPRARRLIL